MNPDAWRTVDFCALLGRPDLDGHGGGGGQPSELRKMIRGYYRTRPWNANGFVPPARVPALGIESAWGRTMTERVSKLHIAEHVAGDVVVLTLSGQLTLDDGDLVFGRYVDELIRNGRVRIVVDLSHVTYIDSAGVGMMVAEFKSVRKAGGAMKLAGPTGRSDHLLAILKLKVVFEIFRDVDAAVRSFAWGIH